MQPTFALTRGVIRAPFDRGAYGCTECINAERLLDEEGQLVQGRERRRLAPRKAGHEQHADRGKPSAQLRHQLPTVEPWHDDVGEYEMHGSGMSACDFD